MFFYRGTKNRASWLSNFKKWSEDKNLSSCYWWSSSNNLESTFTTGPGYCRVRGIQGLHQACAILFQPEPLWLPKTLRYNIRLDSLFFDVTTKGDLGPTGAEVEAQGFCRVRVDSGEACVFPVAMETNECYLWGCSFPVLSVCAWLNFWGSLTSLPINPGFMRQTGNPKNLDLEVPSQTASPPSFRSFYACFFLLVLSKYNIQSL